jgi:hypothetical protein
MHFNSESTSNGVLEREFLIDDVPGVLWSPVPATTPAALILMGHGGGLHKKAQGLVARAIHLVTTRGFHVGSIDAPGHGDRPRSSGDTQWVDDMQQSLPDIDPERPVGYTGMTLATEIGARLAVADSRIGAVVLGSAYASEALMSFARCITVPMQFLLPWDDREIDHDSAFALFDAFASKEKTMHANPGTHAQVPWFEAEDSANFLSRHLLPESRVDERRPLPRPRG